MPKNFFIIGHARSRTAWMSTFLTTEKTFCYHEALRLCKSVEDYKVLMSIPSYTHIGDSDNGLRNFDIHRFFPDVPVVHVKRDVAEVKKSLKHIMTATDEVISDFVDKNALLINDTVARCDNTLVVPFHEINDKLEAIWQHCIGDGFDAMRAEQLSGMNVQAQFLFGGDG